MDNVRFEVLKSLFNEFTADQKAELIRLCSTLDKTSENKFVEQTLNNCQCPYCNSHKIQKFGKGSNGDQRFKCMECGHRYSVKSKTIFSNSKKSIETWQQYIDLMLKGLSLQKIADIMNINLKTSFYWRHKILNAIQKVKSEKLSGIIEADETFFHQSSKGGKVVGRNPRVRGYKSKRMPWEEKHKRGVSNDKVCVLCAIDRNKNIFNQPVCYRGLKKVKDIQPLKKQITKGSILVTDGEPTYQLLGNVKLKQILGGVTTDKVYHIQHINSYHSGLKQFMHRFHGVATKYLDNYVNFFKSIRTNMDVFEAIVGVNTVCRYKDITNKKVAF